MAASNLLKMAGLKLLLRASFRIYRPAQRLSTCAGGNSDRRKRDDRGP